MDSYTVKTGLKGVVNGPKNMLLRQFGQLRPKWLIFTITDLCNSHCIVCNIWQTKKTFEPLTPAEIKKTLSDPLFRDVCYINNTGGEATIRTDLKEVLMAEHEALPKAILQLSTNAILPDRAYDATKYCLEKGVKMYVGVSIDGIGESHDKIRGTPGNFKNVDLLLRRLVELRKEYPDRLWIAAGTVLIDETLPSLDDIRKYVKELGINHEVQWYNASPFYSNTGSEKENKREDIIKAVQALPPRLLNENWLKWLNKDPIKFMCFAMHNFCVLKSNGDISPCLTQWDVTAGNVRQNTPTEIWHSAAIKEARKVVDNCPGCLNSWGTNWSFASSFYPFLAYYLKHPDALEYLERAL